MSLSDRNRAPKPAPLFLRSNHSSATTLTPATPPQIKIQSDTGSIYENIGDDDESFDNVLSHPQNAATVYGRATDRGTAPNTGSDQYESEKPSGKQQRRRTRNIIVIVIACILLVVIVVGAVLGAKVAHKSSSDSSASGGTTNANTPKPNGAITGADGSLVFAETGTTFVYNNSYGGYWVEDPSNPLHGGRAQSWVPLLNETWTWGTDKVHGVNLGGWLVLEPFITPALFQKYYNNPVKPIDEWTLSQAMAADSASGGLGQLEDHYKTFITEIDFAQIAAAGLNWVRIPLPFWAIDKFEEEPFLEGVAWTYFLKALGWARKYGIRVNMDLHTIPGSQNGWNHSGKYGQINFLNGVMGVANAQRTLNYIRTLTEFVSQPEYAGIVEMFGVINEPVIDMPNLENFYYEVYTMMRAITGLGAGHGPIISINKPVLDTVQWTSYLPGADRIALDIHPYYAFGGASTDPLDAYARRPCEGWGQVINTTSREAAIISAGEFSAAVNDCGFWTVGVDYVSTYATAFGAGSCAQWVDYANYTEEIKTGLQNFVMAEMDTLQDWFFWTWKIGARSDNARIEQPFWSYSLGLANGWIPTDPRTASGFCEGLGYPQNDTFAGVYPAAATGGTGAGTIQQAALSGIVWPPMTLSDEANARILPTYTPTGAIVTLAAPTLMMTDPQGAVATGTVEPNLMGNGWIDASDTQPFYVPVAGCTYPDPWNATAAAIPPACTGT